MKFQAAGIGPTSLENKLKMSMQGYFIFSILLMHDGNVINLIKSD